MGRFWIAARYPPPSDAARRFKNRFAKQKKIESSGDGAYMNYLIRNLTNGEIKIGYSESPLERLAGVQAQEKSPMQLLIYAPGDLARERELHKQFSEYRLHGEWFSAEILPQAAAIFQARLDGMEPRWDVFTDIVSELLRNEYKKSTAAEVAAMICETLCNTGFKALGDKASSLVTIKNEEHDQVFLKIVQQTFDDKRIYKRRFSLAYPTKHGVDANGRFIVNGNIYLRVGEWGREARSMTWQR